MVSPNPQVTTNVTSFGTAQGIRKTLQFSRTLTPPSSRNEISYPFEGIVELVTCDDVDYDVFVISFRLPSEGWEAFFQRRASATSKAAFDRLARGPR
jgi:hypothetical protein